jgi:ABC-type transport system involved in cytochrome c biogenesis permease subunit
MDNVILVILLVCYITALVLELKRSAGLSLVFLASGAGLHALFLIARTVITGHAPFSGAFESMIFFSGLLAVRVLIDAWSKKGPAGPRIGGLVLVCVMIAGALFLPGHYKVSSQLMPALKSVFFIVHVPLFFLGYMELSFAFSIALFMLATGSNDPELDRNLMARVRLGYILVTAGLITGSVWAFICWGRFWGWDSKEIWALVTWLFFTVVLHAQGVKDVQPGNKKGLRIAIAAGFAVILFTYLGVMFILPGIHSYR